MDYYYIDTTPPINPINWAYVAPYQPSSLGGMNPERKVLYDHTEFVTEKASLINFFAETKGVRAPTPPPRTESTPSAEATLTLTESISLHAAAAPQLNADIDQIAKQRVRLMAAKYASGDRSSEINARMEILNSRLSERAPLVSMEQVAALEDAYDQLDRIRATREERAKRFGIPAKL